MFSSMPRDVSIRTILGERSRGAPPGCQSTGALTSYLREDSVLFEVPIRYFVDTEYLFGGAVGELEYSLGVVSPRGCNRRGRGPNHWRVRTWTT